MVEPKTSTLTKVYHSDTLNGERKENHGKVQKTWKDLFTEESIIEKSGNGTAAARQDCDY